MQPVYTALYKSGEFKERIKILYKILENCELCPRRCHVNRLKGERGFCKSTAEPKISSIFPHFGEEPELVGKGGSGTIFLTNSAIRGRERRSFLKCAFLFSPVGK